MSEMMHGNGFRTIVHRSAVSLLEHLFALFYICKIIDHTMFNVPSKIGFIYTVHTRETQLCPNVQNKNNTKMPKQNGCQTD